MYCPYSNENPAEPSAAAPPTLCPHCQQTAAGSPHYQVTVTFPTLTPGRGTLLHERRITEHTVSAYDSKGLAAETNVQISNSTIATTSYVYCRADTYDALSLVINTAKGIARQGGAKILKVHVYNDIHTAAATHLAKVGISQRSFNESCTSCNEVSIHDITL